MSSELQQHYFEGKERLEPFPAIGRPLRCGSPDALSVSDKQRIIEALRRADRGTALSYLALVFQAHFEMVDLLFEWTLEWSQAAATALDADKERQCSSRAYNLWLDRVKSLNAGQAGKNLLSVLSPLLSDRMVIPGASQAFREARAAGGRALAEAPANDLSRRQQAVSDLVKGGAMQEAEHALDVYWDSAVVFHDALVQYAQAYPAAALELFGQALSERLIHDGFSGCSFFEGLWYLGAHLNPAQLAAFFAEHLRIHCSGRARQGAARILEEPDRYRLEFDPCGSGGAMRRRLAGAIEKMPGATPGTWNLAGKVPCYCSHCAYNELQSMKRFGYPVLVTEFDPDPEKPCGWTVYKSPDMIPDINFERLGCKKDPTKYKKP